MKDGLNRVLASGLSAGVRVFAGAAVRFAECTSEILESQNIYYANHTSHLDFLVLWSALPARIRRQTKPVAAKDFWSGGIRRYLAQDLFRAVLIERRAGASTSSARETLNTLLEAAHTGSSLILFPEGTRGTGDSIAGFRPGLYHLAQHLPQVRLVPVYLENLNRMLPKGEVLPIPFLSRITFGAPLQIVPDEDRASLLDRARTALLNLGAMKW